jgi:hypothetical protein
MIEWTDTTPPLKNILDPITLYWFTESFPRCIYNYREVFFLYFSSSVTAYTNTKRADIWP